MAAMMAGSDDSDPERQAFQNTTGSVLAECLECVHRRRIDRRRDWRQAHAAASPAASSIREVGLRDGLQSIATVLPTERKREWIRDAYAAGQREIEVGSFVPARLLPQLADTAELVAFAKTLPGLVRLGAGAEPQGRRARDRRRAPT